MAAISRAPAGAIRWGVLFGMGNTVGRTIRIDDTTLEATHGKYARVCVQINLAKPLLPAITVLGCQQRIEYEGLHRICFQCVRYGHRSDNCPTLTPLPEIDQCVNLPNQQQPPHNAKGIDAQFELWMLPKQWKCKPTQ